MPKTIESSVNWYVDTMIVVKKRKNKQATSECVHTRKKNLIRWQFNVTFYFIFFSQ